MLGAASNEALTYLIWWSVKQLVYEHDRKLVLHLHGWKKLWLVLITLLLLDEGLVIYGELLYAVESSTSKRVLESSGEFCEWSVFRGWGQIVWASLFVVVGAVEMSNSQWNLCRLRFGRALCESEGCFEPYGGRAWLRWVLAYANSSCYREFQDSRVEGEYSSSHEL